MQGKTENLDKSNLDKRFLKAVALGAQTIFSCKEFQGEITVTRYANEPLCRFDLRTGQLRCNEYLRGDFLIVIRKVEKSVKVKHDLLCTISIL